jgi:putative tricarboxylic transport membrane protein
MGYLLIKLGFEPAPMLVAFVLGKIMEEKLRQAMLLSRGDPWTFVDFSRHPISTVLIVVSVALLALAVTPALRKKRDEVFIEE